MNLLTMEHITKAYTDRVLLNDVAFSINENEKIGVIGINGMGKSTLLKVAAGIEPYDEGKISIGNQVKICYLPQTPEFEEGTTVLRAAIADNVNELNQWTIEADARSMLNKLGFYDYDEKNFPAEDDWMESICPAVRRRELHWSMHCLHRQISWYWMNRPTTWIMRCLSGWRNI